MFFFFLQCTYGQNNVSSKLFPFVAFRICIAFHTSCFAYWTFLKLCALSPSVTLSDSNLSALFNTITLPFPSLRGSELLWRCCGWSFLNCGKKLRQDSGLLLQLLSKTPESSCLELSWRAHLPRSDSPRATVAFYRTMTLITGFIECKENVAVAWGSLRCVTSVVTRCYFDIIKGIVHPKTKILSSLTHPHVVPNPHYLIC